MVVHCKDGIAHVAWRPLQRPILYQNQSLALAYSHSNSKRPRSSRPMAAGPSLPDDVFPPMRSGSLFPLGVLQVSLLSHWQTSRVRLSGVSHCLSWLSVTVREMLCVPGDSGCWAFRSAEVAAGKQSHKSTAGQGVFCSWNYLFLLTEPGLP